jgi:hypothetical protein
MNPFTPNDDPDGRFEGVDDTWATVGKGVDDIVGESVGGIVGEKVGSSVV